LRKVILKEHHGDKNGVGGCQLPEYIEKLQKSSKKDNGILLI